MSPPVAPIVARRAAGGPLRHEIVVRDHVFPADVDVATGGEDAGPDPHDLYDAALAACKSLTVLWYARRKNLPVTHVEVAVTRDASEERKGTYRLHAALTLVGDLTDAQREELRSVADRCPVHKLMTQVETHIDTVLAPR